MTKLTDTQTILLSTASQRSDGNLLPLPDTVRPGGGAAKAMVALIRRGLAEERQAPDDASATDNGGPYGVFITAAGAGAIGLDLSEHGRDAAEAAVQKLEEATAATKPPSKAAAVLALLGRPDGATLPELIEATGWLPHTTRAALTGVRKKGHALVRSKRDGATCYRLGDAA